MTEKDIILHLADWLDIRRFPFQMPRSFVYKWESDYWAMDATGVTREYEIKISRSDFHRDRHKEKHGKPEEGPNFFYYVCPTGLIKPEEVAKNYGLIYVTEYGSCSIVKRPLKLHNKRFNDWKPLAIKLYWKWWKLWREKYNRNEINRKEYLDTLKNLNHERIGNVNDGPGSAAGGDGTEA